MSPANNEPKIIKISLPSSNNSYAGLILPGNYCDLAIIGFINEDHPGWR